MILKYSSLPKQPLRRCSRKWLVMKFQHISFIIFEKTSQRVHFQEFSRFTPCKFTKVWTILQAFLKDFDYLLGTPISRKTLYDYFESFKLKVRHYLIIRNWKLLQSNYSNWNISIKERYNIHIQINDSNDTFLY